MIAFARLIDKRRFLRINFEIKMAQLRPIKSVLLWFYVAIECVFHVNFLLKI